jgi:translation initiation factor 1
MVKPFHNPFGALRHLGSGTTDGGDAPGPADAPAAAARDASAPAARSIPRAVVRIERSGRGGKEVTVVEHLAIAPADRERWLKGLKGALGCGGLVEGDALVLQGDHRGRLPDLLRSRGVKRVTVA